MIFTDALFILYFLPVTTAVYYILRFSRRLQNVWLLTASVVFYGLIEPLFVVTLIILILSNYAFGRILEKNKDNESVFRTCIFLNIAVFFIMRYLNFAVGSFSDIFNLEIGFGAGIVAPAGMAFFVLRAISYLIDIKYERTGASRSIVELGLYFAFFPVIIAGPLVDFDQMRTQILHREHSRQRVAVGLCRFVTGFAKKLILADSFAVIADNIFGLSTIGIHIYSVPASLAWLGALSFVLQIYYDFSAYCDMAIGIGLIFGFKFPENFDYPINSLTITEFWKKFNITVIRWFDVYVKGSLLRNKDINKDRIIKVMFMMWILIGFWHGANWTFFLWGMFNYALIIIEDFLGAENLPVHSFVMRIYTIFMVTVGFVIYRAMDLYQAGIYFGNMFMRTNNGFFSDIAIMYLREYAVIFAAGVIMCTPISRRINKRLASEGDGRIRNVVNNLYPPVMLLLFMVALAYMFSMGSREFVFYR